MELKDILMGYRATPSMVAYRLLVENNTYSSMFHEAKQKLKDNPDAYPNKHLKLPSFISLIAYGTNFDGGGDIPFSIASLLNFVDQPLLCGFTRPLLSSDSTFNACCPATHYASVCIGLAQPTTTTECYKLWKKGSCSIDTSDIVDENGNPKMGCCASYYNWFGSGNDVQSTHITIHPSKTANNFTALYETCWDFPPCGNENFCCGENCCELVDIGAEEVLCRPGVTIPVTDKRCKGPSCSGSGFCEPPPQLNEQPPPGASD